MFSFIVSRILQALPVMFVVSLISFAMFAYVGDPVSIMLGQDFTEAQRVELVRSLGLDQPLVLRFVNYIGLAVRGEFGISYRNLEPVGQVLMSRVPATKSVSTGPMSFVAKPIPNCPKPSWFG